MLLASGYIAGGAIAGIVIAFMAGVMGGFTERITAWSTANNPFFAGPYSDLLSLIPFAFLVGLLDSRRARHGSAIETAAPQP